MQPLLELCILNVAMRKDIDAINYLLQLEGFEQYMYTLLTKYQRRDLLGGWEKYYSDGTLRSRRIYIDYNHYELTRWRSDGSIIEKCYYLDDELHGIYRKWYSNGNKNIVAQYSHNKLCKKYKKYYDNGQIMEHVTNVGIIKVKKDHTNYHGWIRKPNGHTVKWYDSGQVKKVYDFHKGYIGAYIYYDIDGSLIHYAYYDDDGHPTMQIHRNSDPGGEMYSVVDNNFNAYTFNAYKDNINNTKQQRNKDIVWGDALDDFANEFIDDFANEFIDELSNDEIYIDEILKLV
ncbi:hypothetical protein PV-S19_0258 [Pacmanvirus S19]|nr:hypothetical protein PV-S19_0258 [Pacmanvirus S19]